MLSGFILVHAHRRQIAADNLNAAGFYVKRLARIYPLHFAALMFYLIMVIGVTLAHKSLPNPGRYSLEQFLLNLFLLHALQLRNAGAWNYPSWSISAEWVAYLCFPLFARLLFKDAAKMGGAAILLLAALALLLVYELSPLVTGAAFVDLRSNFGYLRVLPEFLFGMAMYRFLENRRTRLLVHRAVIPALAGLILLSAYLELALVDIALLAVLIAAAAEAARHPALLPALNSRPLLYLGKISYALYMVHLPVSTLLFQGAATLGGHVAAWFVLVGVVAAVATAALAHHWIEVPGHRLVLTLLTRKQMQRA